MRGSTFIYAAFASGVSAHGVVRIIEGANGVKMPGLTIEDGVRRDCIPNGCGSQVDTGICRDAEFEAGRSPLCWTNKGGDVDASRVVSIFMGTRAAPRSVDEEEFNTTSSEHDEENKKMLQSRQGFWNLPVIGALGFGGKRYEWPKETILADTAGQGAHSGLPTVDDNGVVTLVYRQINEDGAGPMDAQIDPSSGGKDRKAFQKAKILRNVPGVGFGGLSVATNTDFAVQVQMPQGTVCRGEIAGVKDVCIVRLRNAAPAGPFGGTAVFTQSNEGRKRAIAYRLKKRMELNRD